MKDKIIVDFIFRAAKTFLQSRENTPAYQIEKRALATFIEEIGKGTLEPRIAEDILDDKKEIEIKIAAARIDYNDEINERIKLAQNQNLIDIKKSVSWWVVIPTSFVIGAALNLLSPFAGVMLEPYVQDFRRWLRPGISIKATTPEIKSPDLKITDPHWNPMIKEDEPLMPTKMSNAAPTKKKKISAPGCNP